MIWKFYFNGFVKGCSCFLFLIIGFQQIWCGYGLESDYLVGGVFELRGMECLMSEKFFWLQNVDFYFRGEEGDRKKGS